MPANEFGKVDVEREWLIEEQPRNGASNSEATLVAIAACFFVTPPRLPRRAEMKDSIAAGKAGSSSAPSLCPDLWREGLGRAGRSLSRRKASHSRDLLWLFTSSFVCSVGAEPLHQLILLAS
ncbi:unnamed protein product [Vitrella brassicaformis CCMP3155]|uniref:Uncharacterized protein n=1 Tax=Vitrella brassicaformis (strain CCMP3155) TaxID=1169540 RepID=A0A0G4GAQ5_VITBC|nr:unnamed protein product [Vitrella brassicaformis CCMP3155]|eukprot:CEM26074.1 unnamed protein product [Vitrella brassicaformis CCMP3155]